MTKSKIVLKSLTFLVAGCFMATVSFALNEARPPGATFQLEQSSETVAQQQAYQGRIDASGAVPIRDGEQRISKPAASKAAASTLSNVARKQAAAKNLQTAEQRVGDKPQGKSRPWWFAIVLIGFGLVGFLGLKDWFGKNIPDMPVQKKKRKGAQEF